MKPTLPQRSLFFHGLFLTLRHFRALLWMYGANLALAFLFSLHLHAQLSSLLDHSLAAERLNSAFDLGTAATVLSHLQHGVPSGGISAYAGQPIYFLCCLLLVPGTLFCFHTDAPARLSVLLGTGAGFLWRFVRITLLTVLCGLLILGPAITAQLLYASWIDDRVVELNARWLQAIGWTLLLLIAAALRLYFDLVEVYTVLLNEQIRENGWTDRRVRRVLGPAFQTLRRNFLRLYGLFLLLTAAGLGAFALLARVAMHMLAQPRVWPMFLLAQTGLLLMLTTRFWQRGAEMTLALDNPLPPPILQPLLIFPTPAPQPPQPASSPENDPIPGPEPVSPSLPEPDPGVFEPPSPARDASTRSISHFR